MTVERKVSEKLKALVKEYHGYRCAGSVEGVVCATMREPVDPKLLDVDHIIELRHWTDKSAEYKLCYDANSFHNLQPLCIYCHKAKTKMNVKAQNTNLPYDFAYAAPEPEIPTGMRMELDD